MYRNGVNLGEFDYKEDVTEAGLYELVLFDIAQNESRISFEINYDEAKGNFTKINEFGYINTSTAFVWTDDSTATLDGKAYTSGKLFNEEGKHIIELTTKYGVKSQFTIIQDFTAPTGRLYGIYNSNGNFTNQDVYLEWTEENCTATIKYGNITEEYISGKLIEDANTYLIVLQDLAGNQSQYSFEISYEKPTLNISNIYENGYTNKNVILNAVNSSDIIYLNGVQVASGYTVKNDGEYSVVVKNKYGNENEYNFIRDTIPCEIEIYNIYTSNSKGNFTAQPVRLFWQEDTAKGYLYKNGVNLGEFDKFTDVIEAGSYELVLYDIAQNESRITFEINYDEDTGYFTNINDLGYANEATTFIWKNSSTTATLDNNPYEAGSTINAEGKHVIELTTKYGVKSQFTIIQDFTAPTAIIDGVENNGFTNHTVKITFAEGTATLNGNVYYSGKEINSASKYEFILKDISGNTTKLYFEISYEKPEGILDGVENGGITNKKVNLSWNDSSYYATINGLEYISGSRISEDNNYSIILYNKFGNSNTYTFTIDTFKPELEIYFEDNSKADMEKALNDKLYSNKNFKLIPLEDNTTIMVNNEIYTLDTFIESESRYEISITDLAGNTEYYYINIIKSLPTFELINVTDGGFTNTHVKIIYDSNKYTCSVNGKDYISGSNISEDNIYFVSVIDKAGNESTASFEISSKASEGTLIGVKDGGYTNGIVKYHFDEEGCTASCTKVYYQIVDGISTRIEEEFNYVTDTELKDDAEYFITLTNKFNVKSAVSFIIDTIAPSYDDIILKNVSINGYTNKNVSIIWDNPLIYVKVNKEDYTSGKIISKNDTYLVEIYDLAGNVNTFTFEINNEFNADSVTLYAAKVIDDNNEIPNDKEVSFTWDNHEYKASLLRNGEEVDYTSGELITEVGKYNFKLVDKYGNEYVQDFEILDTTEDHTTQNIITIILISLIGGIILIAITTRLISKRKNIYAIK